MVIFITLLQKKGELFEILNFQNMKAFDVQVYENENHYNHVIINA